MSNNVMTDPVTGEVLYPVFYGSTYWPLKRVYDEFAPRAHPEWVRRFFPMMVEAGGIVGIGGGWRSREEQEIKHEQNPTQFAHPDASLHIERVWKSGIYAFAAYDTVGTDLDKDGIREGTEHLTAWNWIRDNGMRWGVSILSHIPNERHHAQPFIPEPGTNTPIYSGTRLRALGNPDPDPNFKLPKELNMELVEAHGRVLAGAKIPAMKETAVQLGLPNGEDRWFNVKVVNPPADGWLAIWGSGAWPKHNDINYSRGVTIAGLGFAKVALGTIKVISSHPVDIIIDSIAKEVKES